MEDPEIYAKDKVRFEMMRRLGYFVTESSEHMAEYVPTTLVSFGPHPRRFSDGPLQASSTC